MAVLITSMVVIVLAGAGVLGVAYAAHLLARDRRLRARVRRRIVATAAAFYAARRAAGRRVGQALDARRRRRQESEYEDEPSSS